MSTRQLERAFQPKSLALVGASDRPSSTGRAVLDNIVSAGFPGPIHVVHPRHEEIAGRKAFKELRDIPEPPDLVIVVAPKENVAQIVNEAADIGVPAVIVMTDDPRPAADSLFEQMRAIARERDIRIFGPNCHGVIAPRAKLNASLSAQPVACRRSRGDLAIRPLCWRRSSPGAMRGRSAFPAWSRSATWPTSTSTTCSTFSPLDPMTRAILLYIEHAGGRQGLHVRGARGLARQAGDRDSLRRATRPRAGREPMPAISRPPTMSMTPPSVAPACCASRRSAACSRPRKPSPASSPSTANGSPSSPMAAASAISPSTGCSISAASSPKSRRRRARR